MMAAEARKRLNKRQRFAQTQKAVAHASLGLFISPPASSVFIFLNRVARSNGCPAHACVGRISLAVEFQNVLNLMCLNLEFISDFYPP
jgi:hypothetical protein